MGSFVVELKKGMSFLSLVCLFFICLPSDYERYVEAYGLSMCVCFCGLVSLGHK